MFGSQRFRERILIVLIMLMFAASHFSGWQLFSVMTLGFTTADLLVSISILFMLYCAIIHNDSIIISRTIIIACMIWLLIAVCTSATMPLIRGEALILNEYIKAFFHQLYFFAFLFGIVLFIRRQGIFLSIAKLQVYCSIIVNLYGIYQVPARFFNLPFSRVVLTNRSLDQEGFKYGVDTLQLGFEGFFRATSFYSEPSALAGFNTLILAFLLVPYLMHNYRIIKNSFLFGLTLFLCVVAMFMTLSNTAFFQAAVLLALLFFYGERKHRYKFAVALFILGSVLFAADRIIENYSTISVANMYVQRVGGILYPKKYEGMGGESFNYRAGEMQKGFTQWKSYPILGTGLNTSEFIKDEFGVNTPYANNGYIDALLMLGTGGGLAYFMIKLCMIVSLLHCIWYMRKSGVVDTSVWILALLLFFFAIRLSVEGISSDNLSDGGHWYNNGWWLIGYMELRHLLYNDRKEYRFFSHGLAHLMIQAIQPRMTQISQLQKHATR